MEEKDRIISRRNFFKRMSKGILPFIGLVTMLQTSSVVRANVLKKCMDCNTGCSGGCRTLCEEGCSHNCNNSCKWSCDGRCTDTCEGTATQRFGFR